jgi:hypothetical protein
MMTAFSALRAGDPSHHLFRPHHGEKIRQSGHQFPVEKIENFGAILQTYVCCNFLKNEKIAKTRLGRGLPRGAQSRALSASGPPNTAVFSGRRGSSQSPIAASSERHR